MAPRTITTATKIILIKNSNVLEYKTNNLNRVKYPHLKFLIYPIHSLDQDNKQALSIEMSFIILSDNRHQFELDQVAMPMFKLTRNGKSPFKFFGPLTGPY